jgi:hypothetical protein
VIDGFINAHRLRGFGEGNGIAEAVELVDGIIREKRSERGVDGKGAVQK